VHEAHCPAHGATIPLLPIRDLVRDCLALAPDDPDAASSVGARLATLGGVSDLTPGVLELLGLGEATPSGDAIDVAACVTQLVGALAANEPCVVLLDDVHWMDGASLRVLHALVDAAAGARLLVVTNFRPDHDPTWLDGSHCSRLPLAPLGPDASQALLAELLGGDDSVAALADMIGERTGGNPFFIEEVVPGARRGRQPGGPAGRVPTGRPARLAGRSRRPSIRSWAPASTAWAQMPRICSTWPPSSASSSTARSCAPSPGATTARSTGRSAALEEAELVHVLSGSAGARWAFRHPLTQEVAYQEQLADRRGAHPSRGSGGAPDTDGGAAGRARGIDRASLEGGGDALRGRALGAAGGPQGGEHPSARTRPAPRAARLNRRPAKLGIEQKCKPIPPESLFTSLVSAR
jgi:hypothetical protein